MMISNYIKNTSSNNEAYNEFKNFFNTHEENYNKFKQFLITYIIKYKDLPDKQFVAKLQDINKHIPIINSTYANYKTIHDKYLDKSTITKEEKEEETECLKLVKKYYNEYQKKLKDINKHISINTNTNLNSIKEVYEKFKQFVSSMETFLNMP